MGKVVLFQYKQIFEKLLLCHSGPNPEIKPDSGFIRHNSY